MLTDFLKHLKALDVDGLDVSYYFLENGSTDETLSILLDTVVGNDYENPKWGKNAIVNSIDTGFPPDVRKNRVYEPFAIIREHIRSYFLKGNYDYLFCVDSDVMVNPDTLKRLLAWKKDSVSCVVSNVPSGDVTRVNALEISDYTPGPLRHLAVRPIDYKKLKRFEVSGLIKVGVTGSVFLYSKNAMQVADYDVNKLEPREKSALGGVLAEDSIVAFNLLRAGIVQYLDCDQVLIHCMTEEVLRRAKEEGKV